MNENELRTIEEENTDVRLYDEHEVEVDEDDGPGFGLGVLVGSAIGVGAVFAVNKVRDWLGKRKNQKTQQPTPEGAPQVEPAAVTAEVVNVQDGNGKVIEKK